MSSDEDNDTSDEEYVPGDKEEVVSEIESDGDPEDDFLEIAENRPDKRTKSSRKPRKKIKADLDTKPLKSQTKELSDGEKKKTADDVWADFMKDTGFQSKKAITESLTTATAKPASKKLEVKNEKPVQKQPELVKITQTLQFAGEEVQVEKEVPRDCAEARLLSKDPPASSNDINGVKKVGLSGIGSVLSQLGKRPKITTLEKSKLDWDRFKREENLEEELRTHNKGKDGYLEKQDFLQRADLRRFEIEKEIRTIARNKRMTNTM